MLSEILTMKIIVHKLIITFIININVIKYYN